MKSIALFTQMAAFIVLTSSGASMDVENETAVATDSLRWSRGPATLNLEGLARLEIPAGYASLNGPQSRLLLEQLGNKASGNEVGFVASESQDWFLVIEFHDIGYVSDKGWENLDAASILGAIRTTDEQANAEREQRGWATVRIGDWESAPAYDPTTHTLEWALRAESEGVSVVNRVVSFLGRRGVVQFVLVDQDQAPLALTAFKRLIRGFAFDPGERYSDIHSGDRMAAGGLAAVFSRANASEMAGPVPDHATETKIRASSAGEYWWLIGIVAAFIGFGAGRKFPRCRRVHRPQGHTRSKSPSSPVGSVPPSAPTGESGTSVGQASASGGTASGSGRPTHDGHSSGTAGGRRRRYDAYSFYERLTRDLHWTINS